MIQEVHLKRYNEFIVNRKYRIIPKNVYTEIHHIIPKCYGGDKSKENMIVLTAREHFIAHLILWKCYGGKMATAFWFMNNNQKYSYKTSGKSFSNLREAQSEESSRYMKGKRVGDKNPSKRPEVAKKISTTHIKRGVSKGKNNPNFGKEGNRGSKWFWTEEQKQALKEIRKKQKEYERHKNSHRKRLLCPDSKKTILVIESELQDYLTRGYKPCGTSTGKLWITNNTTKENKVIEKYDLEKYLRLGFRQGRSRKYTGTTYQAEHPVTILNKD